MRFELTQVSITKRSSEPIQWVRKQHQLLKEATMDKIIIALMAIYFLGDPDLQYLSWLGDMKLYIVAAAIALVSMPWIAEQFDG
jgi:hypothetical protein